MIRNLLANRKLVEQFIRHHLARCPYYRVVSRHRYSQMAKDQNKPLQYFPQGNPAAQAQSGNPHLNPSNAIGPQGPGPAPKQIQMPFPLGNGDW